MPLTRAALLTAALLAAGAGCGSDDGVPAGSDQARIIALARSVVQAGSGEEVCRTQLTGDFVASVFGDLDSCVQAGADRQPADRATGAAVMDVAVDGDTATALVTAQGGAADGASGTWGFVRDPATGWRVADWHLDYLRADFAAQFGPAYRADGADDPFADPAVRRCVSDHFQALADAEFRSAAYAVLRGSAAGNEALRRWYYDCIGGERKNGVSTLRQIFEDGLRQADQIPPKVVECVVATLRTTVSDEEIRAMGESGAAATPAGVQRRISRATRDCVDSAGGA